MVSAQLVTKDHAAACSLLPAPLRWDGEENQKGEKKKKPGTSRVEKRTIYWDNTKREVTTTTTVLIKEYTK